MIADVQVIDDQLLALAPLLDRAMVRVHIDHCGRPDPTAGIDAPGFRELLRRGRAGRAVVKLSGCVKASREPYPHADLLPSVRALLSEFGPDHCVWASDWPFLRMPKRIDYGPLLALLAQPVTPRRGGPFRGNRAPTGAASGRTGKVAAAVTRYACWSATLRRRKRHPVGNTRTVDAGGRGVRTWGSAQARGNRTPTTPRPRGAVTGPEVEIGIAVRAGVDGRSRTRLDADMADRGAPLNG